jgi:hypothetical protein
MARTFHRTHPGADTPVAIDLDAEGAKVFRTADGETIQFYGVSADELDAKAEEFLAWAS